MAEPNTTISASATTPKALLFSGDSSAHTASLRGSLLSRIWAWLSFHTDVNKSTINRKKDEYETTARKIVELAKVTLYNEYETVVQKTQGKNVYVDKKIVESLQIKDAKNYQEKLRKTIIKITQSTYSIWTGIKTIEATSLITVINTEAQKHLEAQEKVKVQGATNKAERFAEIQATADTQTILHFLYPRTLHTEIAASDIEQANKKLLDQRTSLEQLKSARNTLREEYNKEQTVIDDLTRGGAHIEPTKINNLRDLKTTVSDKEREIAVLEEEIAKIRGALERTNKRPLQKQPENGALVASIPEIIISQHY